MVTVSSRLWIALALAAGAAACKPKIEGRPSLVDGDRVLAVVSEPAEAKAKAKVTYRALYVNPDGSLDPAALDFALCTQRKPLAMTGPLAPECLAKRAKPLVALEPDDGADVTASIPDDACRVFGPNAPAPKKDEPPSRPADPDTTGGYYQPVRVLTEVEGKPDYTVGVTRLDCGLAGATQDQAATYAKQHLPNQNPALTALVIRHGRDETELTAEDATDATRVKPGATIDLRASWQACPNTAECGDGICSPGETCADDCKGADAKACEGSEHYLALDPSTHELAKRREAIRISWFASDGTFDHERTGRSEAEAKTSSSDNAWVAPAKTGEVRLWVVIRDDRGGVGWGAYKLDVQR